MLERIEELEKEIKILRFVYNQNKLFLESEKELKDSWNATMPQILEFVKESTKRIESLEESHVRLSKIIAVLTDSSEKSSKLIREIIKIIEA